MRNKLQKKAWLIFLAFAMSFPVIAAEKISQIIKGSDYASLKKTFDDEISRSQKHIDKAKELAAKYPKDPRPARNREAWERHISLCEDQFFTVLNDIFKPDIETTIQASSVNELKTEFRRRIGVIDSRLNILRELSEKYPSRDTSQLVSDLNSLREKFKQAQYTCPQHQSFCKNCISSHEVCKACDGKGKWGFWKWTCKLCNGSGNVYAPGKTYCPICHGRWDEGINCKNCDNGLVYCPSHNSKKTVCPNCGTVDGTISGQSLEP